MALGILCFLRSVQAANAACKSNWGWSYNSKGQNPCEVAASLQGPCFGVSGFELQPLDPGNVYANPKRGTPLRKKCGCNTIIFSLYMACTLCQNSTSTRKWTEWSEFCDKVHVTQYPFDIPQNATVPQWAFLDYTKEDKYNPTFAESVGRDPEVTPSTTPSATNAPPTATDPPSEGGDQEGGSGGSTRTNVGAIAGGVIGGAAGLLVIAALVFFLKKRRKGTQQGHIVNLDSSADRRWEAMAMQDAYKPQRLYDPSDPSTFPDPIPMEGYSHLQGYIAPPHHGKYTGNAEI